MAFYRYRKNGGQITNESIDAVNPWLNEDTTYEDVLTDPSLSVSLNPDLPKIWTGTEVRNATAPEIAAFSLGEAEDENLKARTESSNLVDEKNDRAKVIKGLALATLDEINILRSQHGLNPRDPSQIKTAIKNKINTGDAD